MKEQMTKLREELQKTESHAKNATGVVTWSTNGPVGVSMIRVLVETIEAQQAEIERLKAGNPR